MFHQNLANILKKSVYQILRTSFPRRCLYLLHISVSTFKRLSLFAVYQSLGSLRTTLASLIRGEVLPIYFDSCVSTYLTRESRNEFGSKSSTLRLEVELPDFELPILAYCVTPSKFGEWKMLIPLLYFKFKVVISSGNTQKRKFCKENMRLHHI